MKTFDAVMCVVAVGFASVFAYNMLQPYGADTAKINARAVEKENASEHYIKPKDGEFGLKRCDLAVYDYVGNKRALERVDPKAALVNEMGDSFSIKASYFNLDSTDYLRIDDSGSVTLQYGYRGNYKIGRMRDQAGSEKLSYAVSTGKRQYLLVNCRQSSD